MTKEELKELGLSEEDSEKVLKRYGNMVSKERFNEVNEKNKTLEKNNQELKDNMDVLIKDLNKLAGGKGESADDLKSQIKQIQADSEKKSSEYESKIKKMARAGIDNELCQKYGAIKAKCVLAELEDVDDDEDDDSYRKLREKQLKKLSENEEYSFLFKAKEPDDKKDVTIAGAEPNSNSNNNQSETSAGAMYAQKYNARYQVNTAESQNNK